MKHLPKLEYTESDSRADAAFLVGANYGRALAEEDKAAIWDEGYAACRDDASSDADFDTRTDNPYRKATKK